MKAKKLLALALAVVMAVSLMAPAMAAGAAGEDWRSLSYYDYLDQRKEEHLAAHASEYAAFDPAAWLKEEYGMGASEAESLWKSYVELYGGEEEAKRAFWFQSTEDDVAENARAEYNERLLKLYEQAFPGELGKLKTEELLEREGYRTPMEQYMDANGLTDPQQVRTALLSDYVERQRVAAEYRDKADAYRAADPASWQNFDAEAYLAELYSWTDKEKFMNSRGLDTQETFENYLYVQYMDAQQDTDRWTHSGPPTLVVNGEDVDVELTTRGRKNYADAAALGAAMGLDLGSGEVAVRAAAERAGWDVLWNKESNEVILLDREAILAGLREQFASCDELLRRIQSGAQRQPGETYRASETLELKLTRFNSLDGDESHTVTLTVDARVQDRLMDVTVTADLSALLELLPESVTAQLTGSLPKFLLPQLKGALSACTAELIANLDEGMLYVNIPLLALMDESIPENLWFTLPLGTADIAIGEKDLTFTDIMYQLLVSSSEESWYGGAYAYGEFTEALEVMDFLLGEERFSQQGGTLTWSLDTKTINGLLAEIGGPASCFKRCEMSLSVDRSGRMSASVEIRPDVAAFVQEYASEYYYYDAAELMVMDFVMGMLDFRYTAQASGTAQRSSGTAELHWKNQLRLELKTSSNLSRASGAPRSAPPEDAMVVEY